MASVTGSAATAGEYVAVPPQKARRLDWIHESYNVIWVLTYFGRTSVRESVRATPAPNGRG